MWELDLKKAERRRIDAFERWYWRRLLKVPWTASRSNQSILKENSPEYLLEGLMLKLKLQYFGHLMRRTDSLKKTLMLAEIKGRKRRGQQRMRWHHQLNGHKFEQALEVGDGQESLVCCSPWSCKESDTTERLNWTEGFKKIYFPCSFPGSYQQTYQLDVLQQNEKVNQEGKTWDLGERWSERGEREGRVQVKSSQAGLENDQSGLHQKNSGPGRICL